MIQDKDQIILDKKLKCVTKLKPNKDELNDIMFAYNICKYVKSNAIVLSNNFSTIGIGRDNLAGDSVKLQFKKQNSSNPQKLKIQ